MKKKRTLLAIFALILVAFIGATIAYFQSSASFDNIFNTGTYKVVTTEVFESPDNWKPGEEIPKTITTKNEGTIDSAVRVSYTEKWEDSEGNDITSQVASGTAIINLDNTNDWTKEGNYYYYNYILKPNETTSSFMKSVTLNPDLNGVECTTSQDGLTKTCESSNPALGAKYILTLTKETVQADKYKDVWNTNLEITEKANAITYISRQNEGQITPGDVIGIGETEDFYVISSNSEKTVLLAKYNLLVGFSNNESTNYEDTYISPSTPGYGLQSVDAIGYAGDCYSTVAFSSTNYWDDGNGLLSPYNANGASYDGTPKPFVYNSSLTIAPDFENDGWNTSGYSIAHYVEQYVTALKQMGAPSTITGRLLSYEEADSAQSIEDNGTSIIFDGRQSYWLGSASDNGFVWGVSIGYSSYDSYNSDFGDGYGVRPVIEIPTSALQ